ncbi:hypothetical protein ABW20_dc0108526 [Dactylellina cionopaga]|nr:hypothetical protein ABW20_dc0108526 [Dactylellina cionopaga]
MDTRFKTEDDANAYPEPCAETDNNGVETDTADPSSSLCPPAENILRRSRSHNSLTMPTHWLKEVALLQTEQAQIAALYKLLPKSTPDINLYCCDFGICQVSNIFTGVDFSLSCIGYAMVEVVPHTCGGQESFKLQCTYNPVGGLRNAPKFSPSKCKGIISAFLRQKLHRLGEGIAEALYTLETAQKEGHTIC